MTMSVDPRIYHQVSNLEPCLLPWKREDGSRECMPASRKLRFIKRDSLARPEHALKLSLTVAGKRHWCFFLGFAVGAP